MDLREKVVDVLQRELLAEQVDLRDEGGVYGVVVSTQFAGLSSLDRQRVIDKILRGPSAKLTAPQHRRILIIVGLKPVKYEHADLYVTGRGR